MAHGRWRHVCLRPQIAPVIYANGRNAWSISRLRWPRLWRLSQGEAGRRRPRLIGSLLLPSSALSQPRECERDGNEITENIDIVLRKGETAAIMPAMTGSTAATSETRPTNAVTDDARRICTRTGLEAGFGFFYFFPRNPLKRPISAKGMQGNASLFPCISLHLLALIWSEFAP